MIALHRSNEIDTLENVLIKPFSGILRHGMESRIFLASAGRPKLAFQQSFYRQRCVYPVQGPLCCMSTASQGTFSATDMGIRKQSRLSPQLQQQSPKRVCLVICLLPITHDGSLGPLTPDSASKAPPAECSEISGLSALALFGMVRLVTLNKEWDPVRCSDN